jgi:hypothetical protein
MVAGGLRLQVVSLERQVHGSCTKRSRTMPNTSCHGEYVSGRKLDGSIVQIDQQTALQSQEGLVRVRNGDTNGMPES